jgi:hypothetical protein
MEWAAVMGMHDRRAMIERVACDSRSERDRRALLFAYLAQRIAISEAITDLWVLVCDAEAGGLLPPQTIVGRLETIIGKLGTWTVRENRGYGEVRACLRRALRVLLPQRDDHASMASSLVDEIAPLLAGGRQKGR